MRYSAFMGQIMGLSILTGGAVLALSLFAPGLLYVGAALFGVGILLLAVRLIGMMLD